MLRLYREVYLHSCFVLEKHRGRISTSVFGVWLVLPDLCGSVGILVSAVDFWRWQFKTKGAFVYLSIGEDSRQPRVQYMLSDLEPPCVKMIARLV